MRALSTHGSSSRKRWIIGIVALIVAAIAVGLLAYSALKQQADENAQRDASTIKEEQAAPEDDSAKDPSNLPSKAGQNTPPSTSAETPSTPPEKPLIERVGGSPTLKVVATLQKASSGYCELHLSAPNQQTKTYTAAIVISASYYICSFNIDRTSLAGDSDSWSATVAHRIGEATTNSDTRSIE